MPELTAIHIALLVVATMIGAILGSIIRGKRAGQEKAAIGASWQEQIDAQRKEHNRLLDQNKGLMEQVSQFQASTTDAKNRARELSSALQEAFERRDELQREIKDVRNNLETVLSERDQLQSDMAAQNADGAALRNKDERIEKLSKELEKWKDRLPPLVERFRDRNADAERLESELEKAQQRIRELEETRHDFDEEHTRIESVTDPEELTDGLDASNDPAENEDESLSPVATHETDATSFSAGLASADEPPKNDAEHHSRDNLKRIKGIGPAIEKTLNEMGIFSFQQIADMSEYDIDRVAQRLKGFRSRIYREDWIGQARELRDQSVHA